MSAEPIFFKGETVVYCDHLWVVTGLEAGGAWIERHSGVGRQWHRVWVRPEDVGAVSPEP